MGLFHVILVSLFMAAGAFRVSRIRSVGQYRPQARESSLSRDSLSTIRHAVASYAESAAAVAGVIAWHEAGHFTAARVQNITVDSFSIGFGPKLLSFNDSGGVEFSLRALPLGGFVAFPQNVVYDEETGVVIEEKDDPDLLQNRPPLQRAFVISAGVLANLLLTFLLSAGTSLTAGIGHPQYGDGIMVTAVPSENSAAARSGFHADDVIMAVNKSPLKGSDMVVSEFVSTVRASAGKSLSVEVLRNKQPMTIDVVPSGEQGRGSLGLKVNSVVTRVDSVKSTNIAEAAKEGYSETTRLISYTWNAFSRAFKTGFTGTEVGGPISVVRAGASMADYSGVALVGFAATLSINLAVLNSLPLPALDGGQLAFILAEIVSGKTMNREIKESLIALAFGALIIIGAGTIVSDIGTLGTPLERVNRR